MIKVIHCHEKKMIRFNRSDMSWCSSIDRYEWIVSCNYSRYGAVLRKVPTTELSPFKSAFAITPTTITIRWYRRITICQSKLSYLIHQSVISSYICVDSAQQTHKQSHSDKSNAIKICSNVSIEGSKGDDNR